MTAFTTQHSSIAPPDAAPYPLHALRRPLRPGLHDMKARVIAIRSTLALLAATASITALGSWTAGSVTTLSPIAGTKLLTVAVTLAIFTGVAANERSSLGEPDGGAHDSGKLRVRTLFRSAVVPAVRGMMIGLAGLVGAALGVSASGTALGRTTMLVSAAWIIGFSAVEATARCGARFVSGADAQVGCPLLGGRSADELPGLTWPLDTTHDRACETLDAHRSNRDVDVNPPTASR